MLDSVLDSLRDFLGAPSVYVNGELDYGLLLEYAFAGIILCIVVSCVFKLLFRLFGGSK